MDDYLEQQIKEIDQRMTEAQKLLEDPELASLAQVEIEELKKQREELESSVNSHQPSEPLQSDICILEIRAAAGGDEAGLFAQDLTRMYTKFAQNMGWHVEELSRSEGKFGQIKETVLKITGKEVYSNLKYESGVHRVQRVPETESSGRIHTSTATVAVLPEVAPAQIFINPTEVEFKAFRASGHGGQNVNKVSTAVRLKHLPTGITVTAQTQRSQLQNRENALSLLRAKLWGMEQEKLAKTIGGQRAVQVGTGERSEKIRTYNFPQNRITDHRTGKSWHNLEEILNGNLLLIRQFL